MPKGKCLFEMVNFIPAIISDHDFYFCGTTGEDKNDYSKFNDFGLYKKSVNEDTSIQPIFTYSDNYSSIPEAPWQIGIVEDWIYFRGIDYNGVPTSPIYRIAKDGTTLQLLQGNQLSILDISKILSNAITKPSPYEPTTNSEYHNKVTSPHFSEEDAVNLIIDKVKEPDGYWGNPYSCRGKINYNGNEYFLVDTPYAEQWLVSIDGNDFFRYKQ